MIMMMKTMKMRMMKITRMKMKKRTRLKMKSRHLHQLLILILHILMPEMSMVTSKMPKKEWKNITEKKLQRYIKMHMGKLVWFEIISIILYRFLFCLLYKCFKNYKKKRFNMRDGIE